MCYGFDDEDVLKRLSMALLDENIDILLNTNGGSGYNAKIMVDILMNHHGRRRVYIPYKAYSCGTLIALVGDEIYMDKNAHLSPFDGQIELDDVMVPVNILCTSEKNDVRAKMAKKDAYADRVMLDVIFEKLYTQRQQDKIIAGFLCTELPHSYPISVNEARKRGLDAISCDIPKELYEIYNLLE
jgi:hypothetical protein